MKPSIRYTHAGAFTLDGSPITDQQAREHFEACNCDWSDAARIEMSRRILAVPSRPEPVEIELGPDDGVLHRRLYTVLPFDDQDAANAFMEQNRDYGLLAEKDGKALLAILSHKGQEVAA